MIVYPNAKLMQKKKIPMPIAILATILINLSISLAIGVSPDSALYARFAIYPIMVASPVLNTIPTPVPLVHEVPKNATLWLSKMFFVFSSGFLRSSSLSPVSEALLTFISLVLIRTISAGTLSPILTSTMSPGTSSTAPTCFF